MKNIRVIGIVCLVLVQLVWLVWQYAAAKAEIAAAPREMWAAVWVELPIGGMIRTKTPVNFGTCPGKRMSLYVDSHTAKRIRNYPNWKDQKFTLELAMRRNRPYVVGAYINGELLQKSFDSVEKGPDAAAPAKADEGS